MKIKDLQKYLNHTSIEDVEVDGFALIEHDEFYNETSSDYRESAIDKALNLGLAFHSTFNNIYEMVNRFITVTCPICGTDTKSNGGGGNVNHTNIRFRCPTCRKDTITITFEHDSIQVKGKE